MTFEDLGLGPKVLQAIADAGYSEPTPIQAGAIPKVLQRQDVLGIAQTGTGKTASFALPMIEILGQGRAKARMPRSLIVCPTRELAAQVAENFEQYGKYHKLSMALLIGGVSFGDQDKKLMQGVDVLIATPGRLLDQFERGKVLLSGVQLLVVDEADRMLDMGFIPDIERIFQLTPFTRQTLFFSATMPPEIQRIVDTFLHQPARVEVARPASAAATVAQNLISLPRNDPRSKLARLREVLKKENIQNAIVFCNRKKDVDKVAADLIKHKFAAAPIHGDLPQSLRTATLDKFKNNDLQILVASDVAARGLDIPDVSHVLNFDVPFHPDDYVHRIGRTGRAGRSGIAITIATPLDEKSLQNVLSILGTDIPAYEGEQEAAPVDTGAPEPKKSESSGSSRTRKKRPGAKDKNEIRKDTSAAKQPDPEPKQKDTSAPKQPDVKPKQKDTRRNAGAGSRKGFGNHVPEFMLRD